MNFPEYIEKNWAQISFILVSLGYLIKIILDNFFRKGEIRYSFFLNNRANSIETFLIEHSKLETTFINLCGSYFAQEITPHDMQVTLTQLKHNLRDSLVKLQLYTNENEFREFESVNDCLIKFVYEGSLKMLNSIPQVKEAAEVRDMKERYLIYDTRQLKKVLKKIQMRNY